jgi:hypothetical protein
MASGSRRGLGLITSLGRFLSLAPAGGLIVRPCRRRDERRGRFRCGRAAATMTAAVIALRKTNMTAIGALSLASTGAALDQFDDCPSSAATAGVVAAGAPPTPPLPLLPRCAPGKRSLKRAEPACRARTGGRVKRAGDCERQEASRGQRANGRTCYGARDLPKSFDGESCWPSQPGSCRRASRSTRPLGVVVVASTGVFVARAAAAGLVVRFANRSLELSQRVA